MKETNLLTLNNINIANINIANGVNLLTSNKNKINSDQKNLFSDKHVRSNSQNNLKNASRNNSIRESSNNSLNKDSLKTLEKNDHINSNYCPNNLINHRESTGISSNTNKVTRTHFPSQIIDIPKDIVNNQELQNKNDKSVAFLISNRKTNLTNNANKNNYIMDNNLENECGKNDLCFKVYETNKINYPLKIDQGNYYTNSGKFQNFYSHNCDKNDSDNSLIQHKGINIITSDNLQGNLEIGKSLIKFEKKRNIQKNYTYGSNNKTSLNIENICPKNGESYLNKGKTIERNKNEKSPGLTSSNNSASNGHCTNNINNNFNNNSNQANSIVRNDVGIKSSVPHVLEYVNKGLLNQKDQLNSNNHRTSIKSATNQDFLNKRGSVKGQDNSLIDNELNNCLFNNVNSFNKYQHEIHSNDMKYNAPKKETHIVSEINNNYPISTRIDRGGSKEVNVKDVNKDTLTPKVDKFNQAQNLNDISPQKLDKIKNLPINLANKEKSKPYELSNNYLSVNNFINSTINQNSARNTKNQFTFQQKNHKKN
jgi:hypothetical protein